jgi:AhpD family alkylhydroperoxidase
VAASRKHLFRFWHEGYRALGRLDRAVRDCGLEGPLLELVKIRASQLNGCAYCVDRHAVDARLQGETEQRLYALSAWRETPFFSPRERAALAMTEAVTLIAGAPPPQAVVEEAASVFSPDELSRLLYAIIEINAFNRLAVTTGAPEPGSYRPEPATGS